MSFGNNNNNNKIRNVLFVSLVTNNTRKMERGKKLATLGRDQYIRLFQQEQAPIAGKLMNTHGASAVRVITQKMATDGRKARMHVKGWKSAIHRARDSCQSTDGVDFHSKRPHL